MYPKGLKAGIQRCSEMLVHSTAYRGIVDKRWKQQSELQLRDEWINKMCVPTMEYLP